MSLGNFVVFPARNKVQFGPLNSDWAGSEFLQRRGAAHISVGVASLDGKTSCLYSQTWFLPIYLQMTAVYFLSDLKDPKTIAMMVTYWHFSTWFHTPLLAAISFFRFSLLWTERGRVQWQSVPGSVFVIGWDEVMTAILSYMTVFSIQLFINRFFFRTTRISPHVYRSMYTVI